MSYIKMYVHDNVYIVLYMDTHKVWSQISRRLTEAVSDLRRLYMEMSYVLKYVQNIVYIV